MCLYPIREIGHSGQFIFSDNNQSYFNAHMSTYDGRESLTLLPLTRTPPQRLLGGTPVWRSSSKTLCPGSHRRRDTYFHSFITHLLEARPSNARSTPWSKKVVPSKLAKLNSIMKEALTEFWGRCRWNRWCTTFGLDAPKATTTWGGFKQLYLLSWLLVISTAGYLHENSENGAKDWLGHCAKSGWQQDPTWVSHRSSEQMYLVPSFETTPAIPSNFLSDTVDQIMANWCRIGRIKNSFPGLASVLSPDI